MEHDNDTSSPCKAVRYNNDEILGTSQSKTIEISDTRGNAGGRAVPLANRIGASLPLIFYECVFVKLKFQNIKQSLFCTGCDDN